MINADDEVGLVGIPEIAKLAGVTRSAVSNWRKRHAEFPAPRVESPTGALFDLRVVERWLVEKGKLDRAVPPAVRLWGVADSLRSWWAPQQLGHFLIACLVYLEACDRADAARTSSPVFVRRHDRWEAVRTLPPSRVVGQLVTAARQIEKENPSLEGLLAEWLDQSPAPDSLTVLRVIDALNAASVDSETERFELYESVVDRMNTLDRFSQEFSTPSELEHLLVRLAEPVGRSVFDPAVGTGGLLLLADLETDSAVQRRLFGFDRHDAALKLARSRFFLYDVPGEFRLVDSLRMPPDELPKVELVLVDPPFNVRSWGDADLYLDSRWNFGTPPPNSANMAWVQIALSALAPGGRALVILPIGEFSKRGREQRIREALLAAGAVEYVVQLPPRLRRDTSIALAIWGLRQPDAGKVSQAVLLVDATGLGTTGRSLHSLSEADIEHIVRIVRSWRDEGQVPEEDGSLAVVLSVDQIEEADLRLSRYRERTPPMDVTHLRSAAAKAKSRLSESIGAASSSIDMLLAQLQERR